MRRRRIVWPLALLGCLLAGLVALCVAPGCTQDGSPSADLNPNVPHVRVLLQENLPAVRVAADVQPMVRVGSAVPRRLQLAGGQFADVSLGASGWQIGNVNVGGAGQELTIQPKADGTVHVGGNRYHGRFRFVPVGISRFNVINDVDLEAYLQGVIAKEMFPGWRTEAYRAQAVVARTYAIYETKNVPAGQQFDVYCDQRSQMYGGINAETAKSLDAVQSTRGLVVTYGGHIFRAYFSSCCGGVTQSAIDAFGHSQDNLPPLWDQDAHGLCSPSPHYNWPSVVLGKVELTRRFRLFGQRKSRPEQSMAAVSRIDIQAVSRYGRPVRFRVTDARGVQYSWSGEELRTAVNTDAPTDKPNQTLPSSFCKPINNLDGTINFAEGHGLGHGAGMCQWCAEERAEAGYKMEDIVTAAYQRSELLRAY